MSQRLKYVIWTPELLADMIMPGQRSYEVESELPETAEFHHAVWDYEYQAFRIFFTDESWPQVPEGCVVERLPDVVFKTNHPEKQPQ